MSNISLGSGPWDQLFGGGNSPAFGVAAVAALASGLIAVLFIPRPGGQKPSLEAQYEVLCSFCIWH